MDLRRRKSTRHSARKTGPSRASTPEKRTKRSSYRRLVLAPIDEDVDNNNEHIENPVNDEDVNEGQANIHPAVDNLVDNNDDQAAQDPLFGNEPNQQYAIVQEYINVLQRDCEMFMMVAHTSDNWVDLQLKISVIDHRWDKLMQYMQDAITDHNLPMETTYRTALNVVEPYYTSTKVALQQRIEYLKQHNINPTQSSSFSLSRDSVNQTINVQIDPTDFHLKPVDLEQFDGNYSKWSAFRDDFVDQVHSNDKIKPVNKFRRLKALVTGSAATTLGNWQITNDSYAAAWQKLCSVYDNPYLIARAHIEDIFSIPAIVKPTHATLRLLLDTATNAKRQLEEMNVNMIELITMHILCGKLDDRTCADWEMKRNSQRMPQLQEFFDFLEKKARALTNIDNRSLSFTSGKNASSSQTSRQVDRRAKPYTANDRNDREASKRTQPTERVCKLCRGNHGLFRCPSFFGLSLEKRWEKVKDWNLCKNCLNPYHELRFCRVNLDPCRRCPTEHHNSILCPNLMYNKVVTATVTSSTEIPTQPLAVKQPNTAMVNKTQ